MSSSEEFPAIDAQNELNRDTNRHFMVDSVSSAVENSQESQVQNEEQKEEAHRKNQATKDNVLKNLKTAIVVSGVIVAVAGVVFAISKKLREK